MPSVDPLETNGPGLIGVVCERQTIEKVVRKTPSGPLHRARCNRWYLHDGPHREVRGRDFAILAEWTDAECCAPDDKAEKRREMLLAKRLTDA